MTIPEMIEAAHELNVRFCVAQDSRPLQVLGTYHGVAILGYDESAAADNSAD